jgi:hypothetical protein
MQPGFPILPTPAAWIGEGNLFPLFRFSESGLICLPRSEAPAFVRNREQRSRNEPAANDTETTEALLRGLIAECGAMIREQLRPAIDSQDDIYRKGHLVADAVRLMETGGALAEAIARLRGQPAPEQRQRITVERAVSGVPVLALSTGKGEGE